MQPFLAESLDGWLFAAAAMFGGLMASVIALGGLIPASQRNRRGTFMLITPAIVVAVLVTVWVIYGFITTGVGDPDYSIADFAIPWLVMAGPSLLTSVLALAVLWFRLRAPDREPG